MTADQVVCPHCSYSLRLKKRMRSTAVATSAVSPGAKERQTKAKAKVKQKPAGNLGLILGIMVVVVLGPILLFGVGLLLGAENTYKVSSVLGGIMIFGGIYWFRISRELLGPLLAIIAGALVIGLGFVFAVGVAVVTGVH